MIFAPDAVPRPIVDLGGTGTPRLSLVFSPAAGCGRFVQRRAERSTARALLITECLLQFGAVVKGWERLFLKMADSGEPVEVTALRTNLVFITNAVTVGGTPQWFADRLVEKAFITHRDAQGILGTLGVPPARQASQLMDSVFTKVDVSDQKRRVFFEFVDIFSHDPVYKDLVDKLMREGMEHKILNEIIPWPIYTIYFYI